MRHRQRTDFAPDRTYVSGLTTVKAFALIQDATAHSVALNIVVITVYQGILFLQFFRSQVCMLFSVSHFEVLADFGEFLLALVLVGTAACGEGVGFVIALFAHSLTQILVIYFMAIFSLDISAQFLGKFQLQTALWFDGFVSHFQRLQQVLLGNLVHFTFHHHDVVFGGTDHDIHVGALHLLECGVNDIFAINACHTNFGDRCLDGYIGACQGC